MAETQVTANFDDVRARLETFNYDFQVVVMRQALEAAARVSAKRARELLEAGGQVKTGRLKRSVRVKTEGGRERTGFAIQARRSQRSGRLRRRRIVQYRQTAGQTVLTAGSGKVRYAHLVEAGTRRSRAYPFLIPAVENTRDEAARAAVAKARELMDRYGAANRAG